MTRRPSSPLRLTVTSARHRHLTVTVVGDLGFDNADQLADTVTHALDDRPVGDEVPHPADAGRLVLDMTALTYFDSYALSVLLSLRGIAADHGMRLVLAHPPAHLDRLLRRTGVRPLFDHPALPAASGEPHSHRTSLR